MKPDGPTFGIATVGVASAEKSHITFESWAEENHCSGPANHLLCTLHAYSRSRFLIDIAHFLSESNCDLLRWERHGADTWGLADLSTLLIAKESFAAPGSKRAASRNVITDFPSGSAETLYLQMALICRSHPGPSNLKLDPYRSFRLPGHSNPP